MNPLESLALLVAVMLLGLPRVQDLLVTLSEIQRRREQRRRDEEEPATATERSPVGFRPK